MPTDYPATGTYTVVAGCFSITAICIGGPSDGGTAGNTSSVRDHATTALIVDSGSPARAGNASPNPGVGGQSQGTFDFSYPGGNGGLVNSYGGGGGGGAGAGGAGGNGSPGDAGGQVGGAGGAGGAGGSYGIPGGAGGQGTPTTKGGAGTAPGATPGGAGGSGGTAGGGGACQGRTVAVTPGQVLDIVVAAATGIGGAGLVAIVYTLAAAADQPLVQAPRIPPPGPGDRGY